MLRRILHKLPLPLALIDLFSIFFFANDFNEFEICKYAQSHSNAFVIAVAAKTACRWIKKIISSTFFRSYNVIWPTCKQNKQLQTKIEQQHNRRRIGRKRNREKYDFFEMPIKISFHWWRFTGQMQLMLFYFFLNRFVYVRKTDLRRFHRQDSMVCLLPSSRLCLWLHKRLQKFADFFFSEGRNLSKENEFVVFFSALSLALSVIVNNNIPYMRIQVVVYATHDSPWSIFSFFLWSAHSFS